MVLTLFLLLLQPSIQGEFLTLSPITSVAEVATSSSTEASEAAVRSLSSELTRLIRSPGWRGDNWSVLVVSLDRGDTIYSHQPDLPLAPASNLKLYTTAAGLYYLGPEFRYSTYLMTDAPLEGGVLDGDLVLYGTGDPTLSDRFHESKTAIWESFADSLTALGISEIRGDIVGDGSYFVGRGSGEGWQESYVNASYAALSGALSYNDNLVTLHIRPGEEAGWRPSIQYLPGGEGIALVNEARTVPAGQRTRIMVTRAGYDGPIVVRGQIALGSQGLWRRVPVADPARFAAAVFREILLSRGIVVHGGVRAIDDPKESPVSGRSVFAPAFEDQLPLRVLAIHQSPPLQEILRIINHRSDNLYADVVLRTVGRVVTGQGSFEGGALAVHYMIGCETGEDPASLEIYDGSGLSAANRSDARTMIRLLSYMSESPMWESYWATLPTAGTSEGLRRMHRTRAERNLRAKTGTIDRVSALSGYVVSANGERLAFSIISNNVPSTWRAKRIEDAIGARLASFTRPAHSPPLAHSPATSAGSSAEASQVVDRGGATKGGEYRIRRGDTLDGIAKRYRTTVGALRAANPGIEPRRLLPGTTIVIPE